VVATVKAVNTWNSSTGLDTATLVVAEDWDSRDVNDAIATGFGLAP
jgi:hypothetical protein